jgi:hypothetical protein
MAKNEAHVSDLAQQANKYRKRAVEVNALVKLSARVVKVDMIRATKLSARSARAGERWR